MVINGEWMICADVVSRPLIRGELQTGNSEWESVAFIVDTGADRTVLSAPVLPAAESELLQKINQGLPQAMQERLNELIEKRRAETISSKEFRDCPSKDNRAETSKSQPEITVHVFGKLWP